MRVLPESLIEFRYFPKEDGLRSNWLSRIQKSWAEERSVLAWANQGRWHTVETTDEGKMREGNWFRIGFEPLFVDFTKAGTWFMIFSLVKVSTRNISSEYGCAFSCCFRHGRLSTSSGLNTGLSVKGFVHFTCKHRVNTIFLTDYVLFGRTAERSDRMYRDPRR